MKELDIQRFASTYDPGLITGQKLEEIDRALLKLEELRLNIEAIQTLIAETSVKCGTLQDQVTSIENRVKDLDNIETKIKEIQDDYKSLNEDIKNTKNQYQELQDEVNSTKSDIEEMNKSLNEASALAKNAVISVENTSEGTDFHSQIGKVGTVPLASYNE